MSVTYVIRISKLILLTIALICNINGVNASDDWNYDYESEHGPGNWYLTYHKCGGELQSPINIDADTAVNYAPEPFQLDYRNNKRFRFTNSGHSVEVRPLDQKWKLSGGDLGGTYTLDHFHFHWGENRMSGSEHLINGESYPMEIHFVHYSDMYANLTAAVASRESGAVAVSAFFVKVTNRASKRAIDAVADKLNKIPYKGNKAKVSIPQLNTNKLLKLDVRYFYRYAGSLTTPSCDEVVTWSVFMQPLYITDRKLNKFRKLFSTEAGEEREYLALNHRPVQSLNDRVVGKTPSPCRHQTNKCGYQRTRYQ